MVTPHRIHHELYESDKILGDPGDGGTIRVDGPEGKDLQICEMVSAGAETRTLAAPDRPGIRFVLRLMTDGGNVVVTAENGLNQDGDVDATFADASDLLSLISVEHTPATSTAKATYRWAIMEGNVGSVSLS